MWDLSSLIWVRSLPPSPEVSGKRTFPVKYYTMILQCPRIIVVDYFGFEPRSFPSDVWCASPLSQFPEYKNQEIPVFIIYLAYRPIPNRYLIIRGEERRRTSHQCCGSGSVESV